MINIWCAIPVYNNHTTIRDIVQRALLQLPNILVIDDGSNDVNLTTLLADLPIILLRHPTNRGKGAALLTAFHHAAKQNANFLLTLDADNQHFPEDIPLFLNHLTPNTLLLGSREHVTGTMPPSATFGRDFSDFWIITETGSPVRDSQSGFRAYPIPQILHLPLKSQHYNLEMEILTRALWSGLQVTSIPIRVLYPHPKDRISHFHPFHDNLRISLLHIRLLLRQLLPFPHTHLPDAPAPKPLTLKKILLMNSNPLGLALATLLSTLLNILLYPYGILPTLYLTLRLHLNPLLTLLLSALFLLPLFPTTSQQIGSHFLNPLTHPHLTWYIGSHLFALLLCPTLTLFVYIIAKLLHPKPVPRP